VAELRDCGRSPVVRAVEATHPTVDARGDPRDQSPADRSDGGGPRRRDRARLLRRGRARCRTCARRRPLAGFSDEMATARRRAAPLLARPHVRIQGEPHGAQGAAARDRVVGALLDAPDCLPDRCSSAPARRAAPRRRMRCGTMWPA
jgi:hypothetical protein